MNVWRAPTNVSPTANVRLFLDSFTAFVILDTSKRTTSLA